MSSMQIITSFANPKLKSLGKLHLKKWRDQEGQFLVEGWKEIQFALHNGFACKSIWGTTEKLAEIPEDIPRFAITRKMFERIGYREKTEALVGVFEKKNHGIEVLRKMRFGEQSCFLLVDGVEKPGNLGALFRVADGAEVVGLLLTDRTADVYNPNVIRNSVGTFFSVPFFHIGNHDLKLWLLEQKIQILTLVPDADKTVYEINLKVKTAVVVGNEHAGVSSFWRKTATFKAGLPMRGQNDSLNVSVTAGIVLYERLRQLG